MAQREDLDDKNIKKCPLCKHKLYKKYEGLICKNHNCILYSKGERGWHYIKSKESIGQVISDGLWNKSIRLRLRKQWVELKLRVLKRDYYTCQFCRYIMLDDCYKNKRLEVHHIIPVSKSTELFLDEDNCITVCNECHKKLHLKDKHSFR